MQRFSDSAAPEHAAAARGAQDQQRNPTAADARRSRRDRSARRASKTDARDTMSCAAARDHRRPRGSRPPAARIAPRTAPGGPLTRRRHLGRLFLRAAQRRRGGCEATARSKATARRTRPAADTMSGRRVIQRDGLACRGTPAIPEPDTMSVAGERGQSRSSTKAGERQAGVATNDPLRPAGNSANGVTRGRGHGRRQSQQTLAALRDRHNNLTDGSVRSLSHRPPLAAELGVGDKDSLRPPGKSTAVFAFWLAAAYCVLPYGASMSSFPQLPVTMSGDAIARG
jgi:hypothetical protein